VKKKRKKKKEKKKKEKKEKENWGVFVPHGSNSWQCFTHIHYTILIQHAKKNKITLITLSKCWGW
jgi:ADP-heptose:LPS heptosyltransferase